MPPHASVVFAPSLMPRCLRRAPQRIPCAPPKPRRPRHTPFRPITTAPPRRSFDADLDGPAGPPPRWAHTPERMKAPVSLKRHDPANEYPVNESQDRLDEFYAAFLGPGGASLLPDEVKWLAVTHKSFDQGRRGYNDRLAFLGKRIMNLQTSLGLLHRSDGTFTDPPDRHDREPFRHPVVDLLPRLTQRRRAEIASTRRMAHLGRRAGMLDILRWKPRKANDLPASGLEQVMGQAVYAIVGAIALQKGGEVATRIVKDRILAPLGLK